MRKIACAVLCLSLCGCVTLSQEAVDKIDSVAVEARSLHANYLRAKDRIEPKDEQARIWKEGHDRNLSDLADGMEALSRTVHGTPKPAK